MAEAATAVAEEAAAADRTALPSSSETSPGAPKNTTSSISSARTAKSSNSESSLIEKQADPEVSLFSCLQKCNTLKIRNGLLRVRGRVLLPSGDRQSQRTRLQWPSDSRRPRQARLDQFPPFQPLTRKITPLVSTPSPCVIQAFI